MKKIVKIENYVELWADECAISYAQISNAICASETLEELQVARMQKSLDMMTAPIRYCSAIEGDSDYKYVGTCLVHRRELQNIMYKECGDFFEVYYRGEFRAAFKKDFITNNN